MCRLLAYAGAPLFLDRLLVEPRASLISQSLAAREARTIVNGDGCGIGWYGERPEPGVYRGILPAWSDANLVSLCRQIRSGLFLAHVRAATSGEVSTANCHPFAASRHLFMHNGQIGGYRHLRRKVDALIPDDLYALRRGTSDSEAIFLAALGRGLDDDPIRAVERTLAEIMTLAAETGEPVRFAAIHCDGETLHAFRWSSDGLPPSLYWRMEGGESSRDAIRPEGNGAHGGAGGMLIASEPCDENAGLWGLLPPDSVLVVGPNHSARLLELRVEPRTVSRRTGRSPG